MKATTLPAVPTVAPAGAGEAGRPPAPASARLLSVDALRGFDMFWIIGGEHIVRALAKLDAGPVVAALSVQLSHVEWEGFHFFDLIFPLFLFLVGVSIVFSLEKLLATGGRRAAMGRIARRSLLLFVVAIFYYGGVATAWSQMQFAGVLHRIALCYGGGAMLYLWLPRRGIVCAALILLVGYWGLMEFVPFPDVRLETPKAARSAMGKGSAQPLPEATSARVRGTYEEGHNLAHYVDFRFLPGKKRNTYYTNEGLLSTLPAIATTLFGIMAGWVLKGSATERRKVWLLVGGGAVGIALGCLWGLEFPIIKRIWTSSYCLVASGGSAVLLGIFYLIVDVWRWQKWCIPFLWIGTNALAVYLAVDLVDFEAIAKRCVGGGVNQFLESSVGHGTGTVTLAVVTLMLPILLVRFLYQRKIFIRL